MTRLCWRDLRCLFLKTGIFGGFSRFSGRCLRVFAYGFLLMPFGGQPVISPAHAEGMLAPHRAYYSATIGELKQGSQIVSAQGKMVIELAQSCEGWETVQGTQLLLANNQGDEFSVNVRFTGWESRDGLKFHFNYVHKNNEIVQEEMLGKAEIPAKGKGGTVVFSKPAHGELRLPKGTVFPTEHLSMLIADAEAGRLLFSKPVFDGTMNEGAYEISAVIGKPYAFPEGKKDGLARLSGHRGWPVRLAFFPHGAADAMPEIEIGVWLFPSGVAERMVFDHGDFTIVSKLERVEWLPRPKC